MQSSVRLAVFGLMASLILLAGCALTPTTTNDGQSTVTSLPKVIAHRGGTGDAAENTLEAIRLSIAHHADAIWLTVQLSKDGVPMLYRPVDLSALTDTKGPVSAFTAAELARVNAGWSFRRGATYRSEERRVG